jgi:hypothetical protein
VYSEGRKKTKIKVVKSKHRKEKLRDKRYEKNIRK